MWRVPLAPGQSPAAREEGGQAWGGQKEAAAQQTGTEGFSILSGQVRGEAVFPLAPLSHRSMHQHRMAAALHHFRNAASLRSGPARA